VRDTIKRILKEDKLQRYINHIVDDYLKDSKVIGITMPFDSAYDLMDLGWEDEMMNFAYGEYENYGFKQDPEDEDSYYNELNPINPLDSHDMIQEMYYIFIDEKVKTGEFSETVDGWEINQNMWDIEGRDKFSHIIDWNCKGEYYGVEIRWNKFEDKLIREYGVPEDILAEVTDKIVRRMMDILDNEKKFCEE
jgi:hypothetical protein